jgi:hypothetical protein
VRSVLISCIVWLRGERGVGGSGGSGGSGV